MDASIVALAIEALERRKEAIQLEIDALKSASPTRPKWSAAARKAQRQRMRAYWATKKGTAKHSKTSKPGPQSAAAKKGISARMKACWAKRKARRGKSSE
jgi:hypothetical protein